MRLEQYRVLWGVIEEWDGEKARSPFLKFDEAVAEIARLGFDGIELVLKLALHLGKDNVLKTLQKHGLKCNILIFTDGPVTPGEGGRMGGPFPGFSASSVSGESSKKKLVENHLKVFKECVEAAQEFKPTLVNCHSLKDFFTVRMAEEFFTEALRWEEEKGYFVCHETHRKRFLHSPWVARDFVPKFPKLKLTADFSHWINVAETSTEDLDLTQVIEDIAPQVYHTHCRVGYEHGPQVADPRAPAWIPYMEGHERWWDSVWKAQVARGQAVSTMIAEHGPPNYQESHPITREPLADIWDVNHWIHLRRQARFTELYKAGSSSVKASRTQDAKPETFPGESILSGRRFGILGDEQEEKAAKKPRIE